MFPTWHLLKLGNWEYLHSLVINITWFQNSTMVKFPTPDNFDFSHLELWPEWKRRFHRYRIETKGLKNKGKFKTYTYYKGTKYCFNIHVVEGPAVNNLLGVSGHGSHSKSGGCVECTQWGSVTFENRSSKNKTERWGSTVFCHHRSAGFSYPYSPRWRRSLKRWLDVGLLRR